MSADRKKILLVDDSMTIRKLARAILGADYDFVEAENGADASTVARAERPDLIVMDLNMPRDWPTSRASPTPRAFRSSS